MSKHKLVGSGKESDTNRAARLAAFSQRLLYARGGAPAASKELASELRKLQFSRSDAYTSG